MPPKKGRTSVYWHIFAKVGPRFEARLDSVLTHEGDQPYIRLKCNVP